jgi:hypothetical protein
LQRRLERFYQIEETPDVRSFVRESNASEREAVLLRELDDALEIALVIPRGTTAQQSADAWLQLAEGVSHFVYVTNRVRMELPATQLELELQAEVDKFVLLALEPERRELPGSLEGAQAFDLHARLFENVRFLHAPETELGERYRTANALAARYVRRLMVCDGATVRVELRRFYRAGQAEKIRRAAA